MAERYRALFVIGLGEVILAIGSTLTDRGFAAAQTVAFVVAFAVTALIARIYIFRAAEDIGSAIKSSANPNLLGILVSYAHIVMIASLVVASVGAELVIDNPLGHPRVAATVTILGGTALFLAGRLVLQYLVFSYLSRSRLLGGLTFVPRTEADGELLANLSVAELGQRRTRVREPRSCFGMSGLCFGWSGVVPPAGPAEHGNRRMMWRSFPGAGRSRYRSNRLRRHALKE